MLADAPPNDGIKPVARPGDFEEFLRGLVTFLSQRKLPYCFVGGMAMQVYAEHRTTKDVDILLDLNLSNLERAYALPGLLMLSPPPEGLESWANPDFRKFHRKPGQALVCRCWNVGVPTLDMILELAEPLNALDIISRAIEFPTDYGQEIALRVAHPMDLLAMKRQAVTNPTRPEEKRSVDGKDIAALEMLLSSSPA